MKVAKLDCTRYTTAASALNIRGYPTIILYVLQPVIGTQLRGQQSRLSCFERLLGACGMF